MQSKWGFFVPCKPKPRTRWAYCRQHLPPLYPYYPHWTHWPLHQLTDSIKYHYTRVREKCPEKANCASFMSCAREKSQRVEYREWAYWHPSYNTKQLCIDTALLPPKPSTHTTQIAIEREGLRGHPFMTFTRNSPLAPMHTHETDPPIVLEPSQARDQVRKIRGNANRPFIGVSGLQPWK